MGDESNPSASSSSPTESIALFLTNNSLRNDTYECDWAGIHYRISTPTEGLKTTRMTSIYRWDKQTHEEFLIAEWIRNFSDDEFKFLLRSDVPKEFQLVKDCYPRTWGYPYGGFTNRTFLGENGKRYTWKERTFSLKLFRAEGDDTTSPIAEYHRPIRILNKRKATITLQPEALEILDTLIVTFMYSERKRRIAQKTQGKGGGGL